MDSAMLEAFNTQCALKLPFSVLQRIVRHFGQVEKRDPSLCELRFLRALLADRRRSADSLYLDDYQPSDPTQARALADALRMHRTLMQATPESKLTLSRLLGTVSAYLARADLLAQNDTLAWQKAVLVRDFSGKTAPVCGDMTVAPLASATNLSRDQRILLCLTPTDPEGFDQELTAFLEATQSLPVHLHAVVGVEGLVPHLFAFDRAVSLNLAALRALAPDAPLESLLSLRTPCALLVTNESSLPELFRVGNALSLCGTLGEGNSVTFYRGAQRLAAFDKSVLNCLRVLRKPFAQAPAPASATILSQTLDERSDALVATLCAEGTCTDALLALLGELAEKGADFTALSSTLCLSLPPVDLAGSALANALVLALDYHRVAAELSLPSANNTCIMAQNSPRLHLYFAVKRGASRPDTFRAEWADAAAARDFARLRKLLYP